MEIDWMHAGPSIAAAFFASLVECIEALTVVLAVGAVRGWRGALGGTALALAVLLALVIVIGPALNRIPIAATQLALGTLLLLFGMRWLRKAILRAAKIIPMHNETAAYAGARSTLEALAGGSAAWDRVAIATAFKITMIEGIEVVFIVVAIGASAAGLLLPASLGALAALAVVVLLGLLLHRPVAMIPENMLKFIVGVLLCAFGTFWAGEGMGLRWPAGDWSIPALNAGFLAAALLAVAICGRSPNAGSVGKQP